MIKVRLTERIGKVDFKYIVMHFEKKSNYTVIFKDDDTHLRIICIILQHLCTFSLFCAYLCFQPGCQYTVQLKTGEVNVHIERSMPRVRHIQVSRVLFCGF